MNGAEADRLIDALDHAERPQTGVWRGPLTELWVSLKKAQRTRRWVATPLLAAVIATPSWLGVEQWGGWLMISAILGAVGFFLMQRVLERLLPVLEREERIQALAVLFQLLARRR